MGLQIQETSLHTNPLHHILKIVLRNQGYIYIYIKDTIHLLAIPDIENRLTNLKEKTAFGRFKKP